MSTVKTVTSALTAAALVTGIGFAWAQTDEQNQPAEPMTAATAEPISEQTPADPNAAPADTLTAQADTTTLQQTPPADDPARTTPPVDTSRSTTPLPSDSSYNNSATTTTTTDSSYEPAPRADRN